VRAVRTLVPRGEGRAFLMVYNARGMIRLKSIHLKI
jgi:hypothetical protein